jgi:hypothetical protein
MDRKQKIRLLADFNAVMENQEIKAALSRAPSGDIIWSIFEAAVNAKIDSLLSDEDGDTEFVSRLSDAREKACVAIESLSGHLDAIKNSPVMAILDRMGKTLSQAESAPTASELAEPPPQPVRRNPTGRGGSINGLI